MRDGALSWKALGVGCSGEKRALWPKQRETGQGVRGEMQVERRLDRRLGLISMPEKPQVLQIGLGSSYDLLLDDRAGRHVDARGF